MVPGGENSSRYRRDQGLFPFEQVYVCLYRTQSSFLTKYRVSSSVALPGFILGVVVVVSHIPRIVVANPKKLLYTVANPACGL